MEIIDTHSHLFVEEFDEDRAEIVMRAREAGVKCVYMPNIDCESLSDLLRTSEEYPDYCLPMLGLHPTSITESYREDLLRLWEILKEDPQRFVAIGEVGVDLYWDQTYKAAQLDAFASQIEWAKLYNVPVVIHSRNAFQETFQTVETHFDANLRGVFHSFGGDVDEARKILSLPGFYMGINGIVTFKKSTLPEVLKEVIPLERIVLETDCPYLAPVPYRGKRNESSYLSYILECLSQIYNLPIELVAEVTTHNAETLFQKKEIKFL